MMFKKIRRKFIIIGLIAVFTALISLASSINIANQIKTTIDNDMIINVILMNGGNFSKDFFDDGKNIEGFDFGKPISKETADESRFFSIQIKDNEYMYDLTHVNSISQEEAAEYLNKALNSGKNRGYIDNYRYSFNENKTLIIFLDCQKSIRFNHLLLFFSLFFSFIFLCISFVFLYIFSNRILRPVKDSYEKQKKFITNASHELKTPLTIISANNELIEIASGENNYTKNINEQVGRMTSMVKELTTLAKMQEDEKPQIEKINLSDLSNKIINSFIPLYEKTNKKFNYKIENDIICQTNIILYSKILSIILDNANKYSLSYINFSIYADNNYIYINQENDSTNLKNGNLNYLMERFYRDDKSRANIQGSGIGLSILNDTIKNLNGKIKIQGHNDKYQLFITLKRK